MAQISHFLLHASIKTLGKSVCSEEMPLEEVAQHHPPPWQGALEGRFRFRLGNKFKQQQNNNNNKEVKEVIIKKKKYKRNSILLRYLSCVNQDADQVRYIVFGMTNKVLIRIMDIEMMRTASKSTLLNFH